MCVCRVRGVCGVGFVCIRVRRVRCERCVCRGGCVWCWRCVCVCVVHGKLTGG